MTISETLRTEQTRSVRPPEAYEFEVVAHAEMFAVRAVDRKMSQDRRAREVAIAAADRLLLFADQAVTRDESVAYNDTLNGVVTRQRALGSRGVVSGWSGESRQRMLRAIASCDIARARTAMLTLTLPAEWHRKPISDGPDIWRTPKVLRRELDAFRKRYERQWGDLSAVWKLETQKRGAPHFHVGAVLPETLWAAEGGLRALQGRRREWIDWCQRNWHEVVAHDGDPCPDVAGCSHRLFGAHADLSFADRVNRSGRSTMAAYFAKHGVWRSKDYQHETPGSVIHRALIVVQALAPFGALEQTGTRPHTQWVPAARAGWKLHTEQRPVYDRKPAVADWYRFADAWSNPGRWWGIWRCERPETFRAELVDHETVRVARLIARKIARRRRQRVVPLLGGESSIYDSVVVCTTQRSLHGDEDRGFWMQARDGAGLVRWILSTAVSLAWLDDVSLRLALSRLELPITERPRERIRDRAPAFAGALTGS